MLTQRLFWRVQHATQRCLPSTSRWGSIIWIGPLRTVHALFYSFCCTCFSIMRFYLCTTIFVVLCGFFYFPNEILFRVDACPSLGEGVPLFGTSTCTFTCCRFRKTQIFDLFVFHKTSVLSWGHCPFIFHNIFRSCEFVGLVLSCVSSSASQRCPLHVRHAAQRFYVVHVRRDDSGAPGLYVGDRELSGTLFHLLIHISLFTFCCGCFC